MSHRLIWSACCLPLFLTLMLASRSPLPSGRGDRGEAATITIRAGTVLDGRGEELGSQIVTVEGTRITAVGTQARTPPTYDLSRYTLMPGGIDTHVHLDSHFDRTGS